MAALSDDGVVVTGLTANGFSVGDAPEQGSGRTYVAWLGDSL